MDAISILNSIKNKVLDAKNYDLLKRTYELQNENIEQLKSNNEVFKEGNELLREDVNRLKEENESLKQTVAELSQKVSQLGHDSVSLGLSEVALAILELYRQRDTTRLYNKADIIPSLNYSEIKIESALDELKTANIIKWVSINPHAGTRYLLTVQGKKYLAENSIE